MNRNFSKEWKEKCIWRRKQEINNQVRKEQLEENLILSEGINLYNVIKRDINTRIEKVVFYNLPFQEATDIVNFLIKQNNFKENEREVKIAGYQRIDTVMFDVVESRGE